MWIGGSGSVRSQRDPRESGECRECDRKIDDARLRRHAARQGRGDGCHGMGTNDSHPTADQGAHYSGSGGPDQV